MNPPVQPPCANPPSRSSPGCPGAWITPSSDRYSTTTKLLIQPPLRPPHLRRPAMDPLPARQLAAETQERQWRSTRACSFTSFRVETTDTGDCPPGRRAGRKPAVHPASSRLGNSSKAAGNLPVVCLAYLPARHTCC